MSSVKNMDRLGRKLAHLRKNYSRQVEAALLASAADANSYAIVKIQRGSAGGRTYRRGNRFHVASLPGEYPNSDSGELVRGMYYRLVGRMKAVWGNSTAQGVYTELGTSRMAARPWARPTVRATMARARERIAKAFRAAKEAAGNVR